MKPQDLLQPRSVRELHAFRITLAMLPYSQLFQIGLCVIHFCHENRPLVWKILCASVYKINMCIATMKNVFLYLQDSPSSNCQSANTPSSFLKSSLPQCQLKSPVLLLLLSVNSMTMDCDDIKEMHEHYGCRSNNGLKNPAFFILDWTHMLEKWVVNVAFLLTHDKAGQMILEPW